MIDISFKNKTGLKPEVLSAIIGSDSFFYGLFSEDYQLLECQTYQISDFDDQSIIDKVKFDIYNIQNLKIKVTTTSKPYLHSDINSAGKLLKFFPAFQNKNTKENKFTDQDVIVDYGLTKSQSGFLSNVLNEYPSNFHISTVMSNYFYPYSKTQLVAFVDNDTLHMMYGKDTNFIYYNQFNCIHENDYLYFISLVFNELGLDRNADKLVLLGRVDMDSPIYSLLHGYIREVDLLKSEKLLVTDLRFRGKQHYYMDLFATALCE